MYVYVGILHICVSVYSCILLYVSIFAPAVNTCKQLCIEYSNDVSKEIYRIKGRSHKMFIIFINTFSLVFFYRLCSLTLTRLVVQKPLENDLTSIIIAVKMQVKDSLLHFGLS